MLREGNLRMMCPIDLRFGMPDRVRPLRKGEYVIENSVNYGRREKRFVMLTEGITGKQFRRRQRKARRIAREVAALHAGVERGETP